MKPTHLLLIFVFFTMFSVQAQDLTIDVVLYPNEENTTIGIDTYAKDKIEKLNAKNGCINYNLVANRTEGSSPFILEIWESKEFVTKQIFHETRTKKVKADKGTTEKSYNATGVRARGNLDVFCRFTERESTAIIDQFIIQGHIDRETEDKQARKELSLGTSRKLPPKWVVAYGDELDKEIITIKNDIGNTVFSAIEVSIADNLLPPTILTGIAKKDGDKVKEVKYEKCLEQDFKQYGNFYYGVYSKSKVEGYDAYFKEGTVALKDKEGILGVSDGKKEMLPLLSKGDTLYVGKEYAMQSFVLSKDKAEKTIDLTFNFFYDPLHTYTESDKRYIEFLYQSQFLNYRNIRVIAYDPLTMSINASTTRSIFEEKQEREELKAEDIKSTKSITVEVAKAIPAPKAFKSKMFNGGKERDPNERYLTLTTSVTIDSKKYENSQQLEAYNMPVGLKFYNKQLDIEDVSNAVIDNKVEILGTYETDKDKLKKVVVLSNVPLNGGEKFEVFAGKTKSVKGKRKGKRSKKKKGKKKKKDGEIKVKEVLNKYLAIAKVEDGDKELKKLVDQKSTLKTMKKKGGFFSGSGYSSKLTKYYPKRKRL